MCVIIIDARCKHEDSGSHFIRQAIPVVKEFHLHKHTKLHKHSAINGAAF